MATTTPLMVQINCVRILLRVQRLQGGEHSVRREIGYRERVYPRWVAR